MSSDRKSFMILNFSLFEYFLSHSKESSDFVCPSVNPSSSLVNSTLLSTGNDVIDVDKWDPPKIAGIPVYIWPYIIVGLWHFLTATGEALCVESATDCGPHKRAGVHANTGGRVIFTWLKLFFNICAIIFYVYEGSSQPIEPIKHAKKLWYQYF
jgi:hypothetical protein